MANQYMIPSPQPYHVPLSPPVPHRRAPRPPTWTPRRPRSRHMQIREPARCGLFTVSELEEELEFHTHNLHFNYPDCSSHRQQIGISHSFGLTVSFPSTGSGISRACDFSAYSCASASSSSSTLSSISSMSSSTSVHHLNLDRDTDMDTETETEIETELETDVESGGESLSGHSFTSSRSWASISESYTGTISGSGSEAEGESAEIATPSSEKEDPFSLEHEWKDIDLSGVHSALQRLSCSRKRIASAGGGGGEGPGMLHRFKTRHQQQKSEDGTMGATFAMKQDSAKFTKRPPPLDLRSFHVSAESTFSRTSSSPITPTGPAPSASSPPSNANVPALLPALPIVSKSEWRSRVLSAQSPKTPTFIPASIFSAASPQSATIQSFSSREVQPRTRSVSAKATLTSSTQIVSRSSSKLSTSSRTPNFTPPTHCHKPQYTHDYSHLATFPRSPNPLADSNENNARRAGSISALPQPHKTITVEWRSRANSEPSPTTPTFATSKATSAYATCLSPSQGTSTSEMTTRTTFVVNPRTGARTKRTESIPIPPFLPSAFSSLPTPPSATTSVFTAPNSRSESPTTPSTTFNNLSHCRSRDSLSPFPAVDLSSALQELLLSCGEEDESDSSSSSTCSASSRSIEKNPTRNLTDNLSSLSFPLPPVRTPPRSSPARRDAPTRALPAIPEPSVEVEEEQEMKSRSDSHSGPLAFDVKPQRAARALCSPPLPDRISAALLPPIDISVPRSSTISYTPENPVVGLPFLPPILPQVGSSIERLPVKSALNGNHSLLQSLSCESSLAPTPSSLMTSPVPIPHHKSSNDVAEIPFPNVSPPQPPPSRWSTVSIDTHNIMNPTNKININKNSIKTSMNLFQSLKKSQISSMSTVSAPTLATSSPASASGNRRSLPRRSAIPKAWKMSVV